MASDGFRKSCYLIVSKPQGPARVLLNQMLEGLSDGRKERV
jgi:hypothetical protein